MKKYCLRRIFFVAAIFLIFTSCENFLKGTGLKDNIDDLIKYAEEKPLKILFDIDKNEMGTIVPFGSQTVYKVGDEIPLSVKVTDSYIFICWESVNVNDHSQNMDEYIKIDKTDQSVTSAKVLKFSNEVLIRPILAKRPSVESVSPAANSMVTCDSTIVITFAENLPESVDLDMIQILCDGASVKENYSAPQIINNQIKFFANMSNLIEIEDGKTKAINVVIPADFSYESEAVKISMGTEKKWSFRVNNSVEQDPPEFGKIYMALTAEDLNDAEKRYDDNEDNYDYFHIKDEVWIYLECYDLGTDIRSLTVSEELISIVNGSSNSPVTSEPYTIENFECADKEENIKSLKFKHKISDAITADGIVEIKFLLEDNAGNTAEKSLTVAKDTTASDFSCYVYNYFPDSEYSKSYNKTDENLYSAGYIFFEEDFESYPVQLVVNPGTAKWAPYTSSYGNDFKWKLYYTQEKDDWENAAVEELDFNSDETVNGEVIVQLQNIDSEKQTFIKLTVVDEVENEGSYYFIMPAAPEVVCSYLINEADDRNVVYKRFTYTPDKHLDSNLDYSFSTLTNAFYSGDLRMGIEDCYGAVTDYSTIDSHVVGLSFPEDSVAEQTEFYNYVLKFYLQTGIKYQDKNNRYHVIYGPLSQKCYSFNKNESPAVALNLSASNISVVSNSEDTQHFEITIPALAADYYDLIIVDKLDSNVNRNKTLYDKFEMDKSTNKISFDASTDLFYSAGERIPVNFNFSLVKDEIVTSYVYEYSASNFIRDNVKPTLNTTITGGIDSTGKYLKYNKPQDDQSGFPSTYSVVCHYLKWDSTLDFENPDVSYIRANSSKKTISVNRDNTSADKYMLIPVAHLTPGEYAIFLEITDASYNTAIKYIGKKYNAYERTSSSLGLKWSISMSPDYYSAINSGSLNFKILNGSYSDNYYKFSFEAFYDGKWNKHYDWNGKWYDEDSSYSNLEQIAYISTGRTGSYNNTYEGYLNSHSCNLKYDDEKNTYLRLRIINGSSYSSPIYLYSVRTANRSNTDVAGYKNVETDVADILDLTSDIQVYCSEPALIHTIYSDRNLGENPDNWLMNTLDDQELKVEVIPGSYTSTPYNYFIPRPDVPKGNYYCTIVHFADGTTLMSQILKK